MSSSACDVPVGAPPSANPWIEFSPPGGGPVQKTPLTQFPFSMGRNDSTDMPLKSSRVSREHAVIVRAGNTYRLRDLDSTNGTYVNGERIEEATLGDGDILAIADIEFTFFTGQAQAARKTVTQVISFRESSSTALKSTDIVRMARRLQETILHGAMRVRHHGVWDLSTGRPFGYEPILAPSDLSRQEEEVAQLISGTNSRLATRVRESFYLAAVDDVGAIDEDLRLFLPLKAADVDHAFAFELLERLSLAVPRMRRLVIDLPDSVISDLPHVREMYDRLRAWGVSICYSDFAGGKAQLDVYRDIKPDFVKLAPTFTRGEEGELGRRGQSGQVLQVLHELGCSVIGRELMTAEDQARCQRLGCRYGMGPHFEEQAASAPPRAEAAGGAGLARRGGL